jgi:hypothetical protein
MSNRHKVIVAFGAYEVGDVIEPTGVDRDWFIDQGFIEKLPDEDETLENESSDVESVKRGRGRPRKLVSQEV